jgi:hypothetical protein
MKVLSFIKRWGWLIGSVILIVLGFVFGGAFTRKLRKPKEKIKRELEVMKAGSEAAAHAVEENAEIALKEIEEAEDETIASLDETRRAKYEKLRKSNDPELVMRHLQRFADPSRRKRYSRKKKSSQ